MTFVNVIQFNSIGFKLDMYCWKMTLWWRNMSGKVTIVISCIVCVFSWYFKWGKREMFLSILLQREVWFFLRREMNTILVWCQDGLAFQHFRNCHFSLFRYLIKEAAFFGETYEIYFISHWCFLERTSLH